MFESLKRLLGRLPPDLKNLETTYEKLSTHYLKIREITDRLGWSEHLKIDDLGEELDKYEDELNKLEEDILEKEKEVKEIDVQRIRATIYLAGVVTREKDRRVLCTRGNLTFELPTLKTDLDWIEDVVDKVIERVREYLSDNWDNLFDYSYFGGAVFRDGDKHEYLTNFISKHSDSFSDSDCNSISKRLVIPNELKEEAKADSIMEEEGFVREGDKYRAM